MHAAADSIEEFVASTLAGFVHCERGEVLRETSLVDLGIDSLGLTTLATLVEAEYGCAFKPSQLAALYAAGRVDDVLVQVRQAMNNGVAPV